ncbi:MAG TPA: MFS transporter [Kofleriaceae bacterium]|jgi:AAHS family 4-hydroxybenzoate transporter-like MFS transporter|nr:MFS transporter [Kofleriaceae bacterium]
MSETSAPTDPAGTLDVRRLIDERPASRFQIGVAVLCAAIVFLDGYDALIMGYVAPALRAQFHIERLALGPVLSIGLVGMLVGALVFGPVADRIGRRPVLLICPVIFGVGSLLAGNAGSVSELLVFRLVAGLGMGGAMPNAIALTAEYMPKRIRAISVTTMFCGFSLGSAAVGWVAALVIPSLGWPWVFRIGGILPIAITAVAFAWLPESVRFLVSRNPGDRRARDYVARIAPDNPAALLSIEEEPRRFPVVQLFTGGRHWVTPLLWVMFFANLLDLYFVNSWMPTIMKDVGISETRAIAITTLFQIGGTVGAIVIGLLFGRSLSFRVLALGYLTAAIFVFLIGESGTSTLWLVITVFMAGLGVIGAQNGANAMAAEVYPTAARSTGVGWALGVGRIGSIIGPNLGAMMVGTTPRLFLYAAVPLLIAAAAALVVSVEHKDTPT